MKKYLVLLIVGLVLVSSQASALPVSSSNLSPFTATANYPEGTLTSSTVMFFLEEAVNYQLQESLRVDILPPLTATIYRGGNLNVGANPAYYIARDTIINSYFIHFDRVDTSGPANTTILASLTFGASEQILGIMTSVTSLNLSNEVVGRPGITYASDVPFGGAGLESTNDTLEWMLNSDGTTTLNLNLRVANTAMDGVRLITAGGAAPVPEPVTMLLLGTGLIGLAGFGRRKLVKRR